MEKTAASKFGSSPAKLRFFTIFASDYPTDMNFRKISLLVLILLIADQALKIWVKTHMHLDESIVVFPDWFQLRFIENNGAAFGMHIATKGGFDWGKLLLGIFRIVMVGVIGWLMHHLINKRKDTPKGVIVGLALVMAGALGDALYGRTFRRTLRRIHDGQGRRHVLFPALPVERCTAVPELPGGQQQLLFRGHLQPGRCLYLHRRHLSASVSVQIPEQVDFFRKNSW